MKHILLASALSLGLAVTTSAQSSRNSIELDNKMQPGLVLELPASTSIAEGTLLQKLKATGYTPETSGAMFWKKSKHDGFYVFNGVQLPDLNNQKLDLYFKVEQKSRKEKGISNVSMLVSKGYDNFVSAESDSATFEAASRFLNGFVANTQLYSLEQDIAAQEKALASAEKKMTNLQDDNNSLRKKIEQYNADLVNNQADIEKQAKEVANQRSILEALKLKK